MSVPLSIDPVLFSDETIDPETRAFNEEMIAVQAEADDMWLKTPAQIRQARLDGGGPFPIEAAEASAENKLVEFGNRPSVKVRIFKPKLGTSRGTYLHFHGGGWALGTADGQDERLQDIADNCLLNCVSVDYRLAPEHPYPCGPDDCETAALWLLQGEHDLNTETLTIGGESAGAHLSVVTMLRLRNALGKCPFHGANLTAGVYDLGQSPSAKNWGQLKLILNTRDMQMFATGYLQNGENIRDEDVSPFFASLEDMPPALFSVGTKDLLLDDSLLMASRWHAQNGNADLHVTPGGCHVFQSFRHLKIAMDSNARIDAFLNSVGPART